LLIDKPEILATACPLCKKTFTAHAAKNDVKVMDISELVYNSLPR
jgi:Fe-S oxidoreductase